MPKGLRCWRSHYLRIWGIEIKSPKRVKAPYVHRNLCTGVGVWEKAVEMRDWPLGLSTEEWAWNDWQMEERWGSQYYFVVEIQSKCVLARIIKILYDQSLWQKNIQWICLKSTRIKKIIVRSWTGILSLMEKKYWTLLNKIL